MSADEIKRLREEIRELKITVKKLRHDITAIQVRLGGAWY